MKVQLEDRNGETFIDRVSLGRVVHLGRFDRVEIILDTEYDTILSMTPRSRNAV